MLAAVGEGEGWCGGGHLTAAPRPRAEWAARWAERRVGGPPGNSSGRRTNRTAAGGRGGSAKQKIAHFKHRLSC